MQTAPRFGAEELWRSREDALHTCRREPALRLYEEERPSRERRAEILEQQQALLSEMQALVEDTRGFNGHAAYVREGFAEGHSY